MDSVYLIRNLVPSGGIASAALISVDYASREQFSSAQEQFTQEFVDEEMSNEHAHMTALYSFNSIHGMPYAYSLSANGSWMMLFAFEGIHSPTQIAEASQQLRHQGDVVSLNVHHLRLVDGKPPAPFVKAQQPAWIESIATNQDQK